LQFEYIFLLRIWVCVNEKLVIGVISTLLESPYWPLEKHLPILLKKYNPPTDHIQKINDIMIRGIS
jgi:hypothetical protein